MPPQLGEELITLNSAKLFKEWLERVRRSHFAHNLAAASAERLNRWLGIAAITFSAAAGTTVFATLEKSPEPYIKIAVGLFTVAAAVLAALQTGLKYSQEAPTHRIAAAGYGELRTELERLLAFPPAESAAGELSESFRSRWKTLNKKSPIIFQRAYDCADRKIEASKNENLQGHEAAQTE